LIGTRSNSLSVWRSYSYLSRNKRWRLAIEGPGACAVRSYAFCCRRNSLPPGDGNLRIKAAVRRTLTRSTNHNQVFNGLLLLTYSKERLNSSL
jgi:hypothetical protein